MGSRRRDRLRGADDFRRVFRRGVATRTKHLVVYLASAPNSRGRWGLVVSGKVGGAVTRNRVRRQLREAVRAAGGVRDGLECVIVAQRAGPGMGELAAEIKQCLESYDHPSS